jgi:hypothetical protein
MICNRASARFKKSLLILFISFLFWSCEEMIEVKLKNENPKVVIESFITNGESPVMVKITKSQPFFNQSNFAPVKNAYVQLEYLSWKEKLIEREGGNYVAPRVKGLPGTDYTLKITTVGESFAATVNLPYSVHVDTAYFQTGFFRNDSLNVVVEFRDPAVTENYYRIKLYRNGRYAINDYYLLTDAFSNGGKIVAPIYYHYFTPGDSVVVELLNLERSTWRYFKGISESIQQGVNSQAPGNPPSNFSGGALGIFGAWNSSFYRIIVPKTTGKK